MTNGSYMFIWAKSGGDLAVLDFVLINIIVKIKCSFCAERRVNMIKLQNVKEYLSGMFGRNLTEEEERMIAIAFETGKQTIYDEYVTKITSK